MDEHESIARILHLRQQKDFQLGDTITIRGKVALDKDFGAGYVYPLIVEEAKQVE